MAEEPQQAVSDETQEQLDEADFGEVFGSWEFPEHEKHSRSRRWYFITIILLVALFFYAYIDNNPLLAVILILGIISFVITEIRGPDYHSIIITEDGLIVGDVFYAYEELRDFYIIYEPPEVKMLYVEPKSMFRPRLGIPLMDIDPVSVRDILLEYLPEDVEKEQEPASDFFGRLFKF